MEIPQYVTRDEVKRVSQALNIRNWSALETIDVTIDETRAILTVVGGEAASLILNNLSITMDRLHSPCKGA